MTARVASALAAVLLLFGLFGIGAGLGQLADRISMPGWFTAAAQPPPGDFPVLAPSRPLRIAIPSIDVRAPIVPVGLATDGSIAPPPLELHNEAGWYEQGPTPGQYGPAVLVGHVDTHTGPAVFARLGKLRPGARIEIDRRDGHTAVFTVTSVEHFAKSRLPAKRVYGDFRRPGLRLITCGGRWVGPPLGYADNVVVFAALTSS